MDGGTWWATVHGVAKSRPRLSTSAHMSSRFINFAVNYNLLSFSRLNKIPCVHVCDSFFNYSSTDRYLSCFHALAIVNSFSEHKSTHIS